MAIDRAVQACAEPCRMDADSVKTLILSVSDTTDPAGELGAMLDDLVQDPRHRAACIECERAILVAAKVK